LGNPGRQAGVEKSRQAKQKVRQTEGRKAVEASSAKARRQAGKRRQGRPEQTSQCRQTKPVYKRHADLAKKVRQTSQGHAMIK
jgi:hypothetical protein